MRHFPARIALRAGLISQHGVVLSFSASLCHIVKKTWSDFAVLPGIGRSLDHWGGPGRIGSEPDVQATVGKGELPVMTREKRVGV